jgi:hypothetical protein
MRKWCSSIRTCKDSLHMHVQGSGRKLVFAIVNKNLRFAVKLTQASDTFHMHT